jgi:hypothetical protein
MPSAVIIVTAITSGLGVLLNSLVLYLVLSRGRKAYHYLFAGVLLICVVWDLGIFLTMIRNNHVEEVVAYGYAIIPCGLLPTLIYHFTCSYLNQPRKWTTIAVWAYGIFAVVGLATGLVGSYDGVFRYPWGNIFRPDQRLRVTNIAALPIWYVTTLSACWFLFRAYRRETSPIARRHLLYILASLFAISMAIVKVIVVLGVEQGFVLTLGMLLNDISAAIIGVAIVKDRLFDITVIVKVGLIYSALAALVILVFSISEHLLTTYVVEKIGGHSGVVHLILLAVVIAVLMPVKHRLEHAVEKFFAQRQLRF